MKDVISKFYSICEYFEDDLDAVSIAIRAVGATNRPTWIRRDLSELWIKKYLDQIDFLYELIKNKDAIHILRVYIDDIQILSKKFNFTASHFVKKGIANKDVIVEETQKCKKEKKYDNQMCFDFGEL